MQNERDLRQYSIAVALPARAERTLLNFLCSCLSCAFFVRFECSRTRHESRTTFNFLDVPARLIFHVIKIGRSTRAGKATPMENCLYVAKRALIGCNLQGCGGVQVHGDCIIYEFIAYYMTAELDFCVWYIHFVTVSQSLPAQFR